MAKIFKRFQEKYTHHLETRQRGDVEGKNWVKPLLCLQLISGFRILIETFSDDRR